MSGEDLQPKCTDGAPFWFARRILSTIPFDLMQKTISLILQLFLLLNCVNYLLSTYVEFPKGSKTVLEICWVSKVEKGRINVIWQNYWSCRV